MSKRVLSFDFGASSGRAVIGYLENGKIVTKEIHRFSNEPVMVGGTLYWDYLRLFFDIKQGILKAKIEGGFDSIGIDTWGVDFALIDKSGQVINNPVHYRDTRTEGMQEQVFKKIDKRQLYMKTGLQFMNFNTIFQLYSVFNYQKQTADLTDKILLMADFFAYLLTGEKRAEFTLASTTQLLDHTNNNWNKELAKSLNINPETFPPIIESGGIYGYLKQDICKELGVQSVPVIAVCTHDTASAVLAVPSLEKDILYISSGTWSLFGTEQPNPIINEKAYAYSITNERGYKKSARILKNIMGLWIIQECKRHWEKEGTKLSFDEIAKAAEKACAFSNYIDVDDETFLTPFNMPEKIQNYCKIHNQNPPQTIGEIARTVYESLAAKYKTVYAEICALTGKKYNRLNIVGGGSSAEILCRYTAESLNIEVVAGPGECTIAGNIAVQLIALHEIENQTEAREIIKNSNLLKTYLPQNPQAFNEYCAKYIK